MDKIAVIRIKGQIGLRKEILETLTRLRIHRKYTCAVYINPNPSIKGMIKKSKDCIAFGNIDDETFKMLVEKRAKLIDKNKKTDLKKVSEELLKGKSYEEMNIKPYFRLSPPIKGIETKKYFGKGKGVLGDNKDKINDLIRRMLE